MDIQKIKKIIAIFEKSNITELEILDGKNSIRISCLSDQPYKKISQKNLSKSFNLKELNIKKDEKEQFNNIKEKSLNKENKGYIVRSPMVGIFYITPGINSEPFIKVGQKIKNGDVLCIVEAMKMMNQIVSDRSGIIKEIFIEHGQPVEFDQPLLIIE